MNAGRIPSGTDRPAGAWQFALHLPVRLRLSLWYTALLAGGLLLFSITVYLFMSHSLVSNLDVSLHQRVNQIIPTLDVVNGRVRMPQPTEEPDTPFIPVLLLDRSGRPLQGTPPGTLRVWLAQHGSVLPGGFSTWDAGGIRFATAPVEDNNRPVGYILAWQSLQSIDQARHSLLILMLGAGPVLLLLAGVGGTLLARRSLSPVARITQIAAGISATDLHRRVPVGPTRDELNELAGTFNAMIERLEGGVDRERRFTSDASHELRSPLAVILAEATLALEQPLERDEYRRALDSIQEQATGMQELITALLTLARTEGPPAHPEIVTVAEVVERAMRHCRPQAQERDVHISGSVQPGLRVDGNSALLARAIRNVLDNAIKASPRGGTVRYQAVADGAAVAITIEDKGPGIAPADAERIFEPFYQIERARTPADSHGLGLAICRRIVRAHGGNVKLIPTPATGACFLITLPTATGDSGADPAESSFETPAAGS